MKKSIFYLPFIAAGLFLSCEKEEDGGVTDNTSDAPVFYAKVEDAVTKAGFNYDGAGTYTHFWNAGDQVAIFPKEGIYDIYSISNPSTGLLTLETDNTGEPTKTYTKNAAVYPASYIKSSNNLSGQLAVNLPVDSPEYDSSSPIYGFENILLGTGDDNTLSFTSAVGWLKIRLKGDFAVKNIKVQGNNNEMLTALYKYYGMPNLDNGATYDEKKFRNIRFKSPYPVLSTDSVTDFYVAIIPGYPRTTFSKGCTITITKSDDSEITLVNKSSFTIEKNMVTPLAVVDADAAAVLSTGTNLGASGTANCYIVSSAGSYFFKAVRGNSSTSVGTVASAEVIWETQNTSSAISTGSVIKSVSTTANYIAFSTADSFTEGNALIAAKDAGGNILYSWHIWCTDAPQDVTIESNSVSGTFMDRNLGALSAAKNDGQATYGLYYQWGRKDPFYHPAYEGAASVAYSYDTTVENCTASYADAHPTVGLYNDTSKDWLNPTDYTRWSYTAKTENDPCPRGYRVYATTAGDSASDVFYQYISNGSTDDPDAGKYKETSSAYVELFVGDTTEGEMIIPYAGRLLLSTPTFQPAFYSFWRGSETSLGKEHTRYLFRHNSISNYSTPISPQYTAYPVRCVKIAE